MKRIILSCLLCLLTLNVCFSQNTYPKILGDSLIVITPIQLRETNLIFLDRERLVTINELLNKKCKSQEDLINLCYKTDSLRKIQVDTCMVKIEQDNTTINKLQKNNTKLKRFSKIISCITGGLAIALGLIIAFK